MKRKKIVVKGSGANLYRITYNETSSGRKTVTVEKVSPGFISSSYKHIGTASSLEDALSIVRSYSGREIDKIADW